MQHQTSIGHQRCLTASRTVGYAAQGKLPFIGIKAGKLYQEQNDRTDILMYKMDWENSRQKIV